MSFYKTLALVSLVSLTATPSLAAKYNLDASHSEVGFKVRHMMVSNTKGQFDKYTGSVSAEEKDFLKTMKINVQIDPASINTNDKKRDGHLRSADFFDVKKFPKMGFKSTRVKVTGKNKADVTGLLTIHGKTQAVILKVEGFGTEVKGPYGMLRRGGTAETVIDRKDFGLTWNTALETGGVAVSDEVKITLEIEVVKEVAKTKK